MITDLAFASATDLLNLYRTKKASPVEATAAALARAEAHQAEHNAFVLIDHEAALASARASEARWMKGEAGLVDGVPTTIKDMFLTKGWPTLRGSRTISADGPWDEDSPLTASLRRQGAVLLGKTAQSEFGWKGVTDSPRHGITRNPWNRAMTPGGSSGGAGVAAALGMGALHAGGDGGGSIRIPASFCGIFGIKPSFGRVPNYPAKMPGSITHAGPMTRTVQDAALMLTVMAAPDARDWRALPPDARDWRKGLEDGVRGMRIAFSPTLGFATVDPEVAAIVARAAARFAELGAEVEQVDPDIANPRPAFELYYTVRFSRLCRLLGEAGCALLDPGIVALGKSGERFTLQDALEADAAREELGYRMNLFLDRYDLLLTPQMPIAAFEAGLDFPARPGFDSWFDWSPFTYLFNFTGQPAASVPCGFTEAGLPVGLQVVGPRHHEDKVLRAARAFERVAPFRMPG